MTSALRGLHPTGFLMRSGILGAGSRAAAPAAATPSTAQAACATRFSPAATMAGHKFRPKLLLTASNCKEGSPSRTILFTRSFRCASAIAALTPESPGCGCMCTTSRERRSFSSTATTTAKELVKTINNEIQHEQSTYEADGDLKKFLQTSGWELTEQENDMMVTLKKEVAGKKVVVEFSCVQNAEAPSGEEGPAAEMSDFTVTITKAGKEDGEGLTFYCSTTQDEEEKFRYCVGQVRLFKSAEEKESLSVYPGPYFEDLDDAFQQSLDDWLSKMGVDNDLCDFIDKFSVDKESREYLAWLKKLSHFVTE